MISIVTLQKLGSPVYLEQLSAVNLCCVLNWKQLWTLSHYLLITHHIFNCVQCLALPHGLGSKGSSVLQTVWAPARREPVKCLRSLKDWLNQPFCWRASLSTSQVLCILNFDTRCALELVSSILLSQNSRSNSFSCGNEQWVGFVWMVFWFKNCFRQKQWKCCG